MVHRKRRVFVILMSALASAIALSVWAGTIGVSFFDQLRSLSLPRLLMSLLAGASLAMAGAMFQGLFRNPLASPYTLGVSSGASLAAAIVLMMTGGGLWFGVPIVSLAAFGGALVCVTIVYFVAHLRAGQATATLLLAGIAIAFICSALIVIVLLLAESHDLRAILQWMMGSVEVVGLDPIYETTAMAVLAGGLAFYLHRDLDLLMMGETIAAARGVSVRRVRFTVYFAASLMTASVVAHCGPIGFVGLMVPHIARFLVGPRHRDLLPACALLGAAFLCLCDVLARNAIWWLSLSTDWLADSSRKMPVGVLTNLLGGVFFLYLLLRRGRHSEMS